MSIALVITDRDCSELKRELIVLDSKLEIEIWPTIKNPKKVTFAVLWKQPKNYLSQFQNLRAVTSLGAGMDFIESDQSLPQKIPIHRVVTDGLKQQMAQYVISYLLSDYRNHSLYTGQQVTKKWKVQELEESITVGFLGLGKIGEFVAIQLQLLGFNVIAWTNSQKHLKIPCCQGDEGFKEVVSTSDYIVGLLPLNKGTKNLIDLRKFKWFKKDSMLIQVGRGEQIIEDDLVKALDQNYLRKAVLDVFAVEPLPSTSSLWAHPKIEITPHNSARSDNKQTAQQIYKIYKNI